MFFLRPSPKKAGFFVGLKRFFKNRLTNSENKIDFKTSKAANARSRESPKGRLGCNKPTKQKNSMAAFRSPIKESSLVKFFVLESYDSNEEQRINFQ